MQTTITNIHGEKIHVKIEEDRILVHHTDCSEDYITFDELILKYVTTAEEIISILNAAKTLYLPIILEKVKQIN